MLTIDDLGLARCRVGFPANATERLLSIEFGLWFGNDGPDGPVPLASMSNTRLEHLVAWLGRAARAQPAYVEAAEDKVDKWTEAAYFVAWHRLASDELARRTAARVVIHDRRPSRARG